ncbi:hypothetical protein B0H13DRAFT_1871812 [Mycena leptocephala]|nr:hypothetical protein B0H13DRAFT_1871812 [Mycena leptocephala]
MELLGWSPDPGHLILLGFNLSDFGSQAGDAAKTLVILLRNVPILSVFSATAGTFWVLNDLGKLHARTGGVGNSEGGKDILVESLKWVPGVECFMADGQPHMSHREVKGDVGLLEAPTHYAKLESRWHGHQ